MIGFTAPALLAGLAAVAVPIAIHLWSHRPSRIIRVGSTKLLAESRPARARRVALTDIPRLLLRIAAVVCAVMAAAGLAWFARRDVATTIALVDPTVATDPTVRHQVDSLSAAGIPAYWLGRGTPTITTPAPDPIANVWIALANADARFPRSQFVVAAPAVAQRYEGVRPALASRVSWLRISTPAVAGTGTSTFNTSPHVGVAIATAPGRDRDAEVIVAALHALADTRPIVFDIGRTPASGIDTASSPAVIVALGVPIDAAALARTLRPGTILLADSLAPPSTAASGVAHWRDASGAAGLVVTPLGAGLLARVTTHFSRATVPLAASAAFPDSLAALLLPPVDIARDQVVTDTQRSPSAADAQQGRAAITADLAWMMALLALSAFVIDRIIANRRVIR